MPLWSDMNGFPEGGFPILASDGEQICMGTFYPTPLKANNLILDVVGNNRLLGALVIGGGLSGVTTLAMGGALSGVTTLGASGLVTLSGASPLSITNQNAVILITGDNASLGTLLQRVSRGFFKNLEITNTPTVNGEPVALISDLVRYIRSSALTSFSALTPSGGAVTVPMNQEANNATVSISSDLTINFSSITSGGESDIRITITSGTPTITLAASGVTFKGNGTLTSLSAGVYHICCIAISSTEVDWNISKYV